MKKKINYFIDLDNFSLRSFEFIIFSHQNPNFFFCKNIIFKNNKFVILILFHNENIL